MLERGKMRVIAGTARSIPLVTPEGNDTRPTTDRIKETLFNILQQDIQESVFFDVFAGSGAIGVEALSRGAQRAYFIDNSRAAIQAVTANVKKCRFEDRAEILKSEAAFTLERLLTGLPGGKRVIIFMDPPYDRGLELPVLSGIKRSRRLTGTDLVILETSLKADPLPVLETGFELIREKRYKNQKHLFLRIC